MQAEESIKVDHVLPRDGNRKPHAVVGALTVRDHDVKTVSGAALEQHHQPFPAQGCAVSSVDHARQKAENRAGADDGQCAVLQKNSSYDRHSASSKIIV